MFTEPVPKVRMDSGGEKCQTLFSLHLLSCPVLDGYNYYLRVGSCNKIKGGSWKQMFSKDKKHKQEQEKGNKQARTYSSSFDAEVDLGGRMPRAFPSRWARGEQVECRAADPSSPSCLPFSGSCYIDITFLLRVQSRLVCSGGDQS